MIHTLSTAYREFLLSSPKIALFLAILVLGFFAYHAKDFRLDASADSLLLEGDKDLKLFREVSHRYRASALLVVTFTPANDVFSDDALDKLKALRDEIGAVESVDSFVTILDVPLLKSSDVPLSQIASNVQTLEKSDVDRQRARDELMSSPVYKDLIISTDGRTTALLINLKEEENFVDMQLRRGELLEKRRTGQLSDAEREELPGLLAAYEEAHEALNNRWHDDIAKIRSIIDRYKQFGTLHLGGVPMITDDMVTFVKSDLVTFGSGVLVFLVIVLAVIFRQLRWVVMPLLGCFYAGLVMIGMLGLFGWKVTVISSNFLSLMFIITISMNVHLAVRYRQLCRDHPEVSHADVVAMTVRKMVWPCLYTALTTIIGFSSLVFSEIKPVIDFGWMMSIGLLVAFVTSFTLFPAIIVLLDKSHGEEDTRRKYRFTAVLAEVTERHGNKVLAAALLLVLISAVGISKLEVENSFINYFSKKTEIYQGMKLIDDQLGGTTPLDILLDLDEDRIFAEDEEETEQEGSDGETEEEWEEASDPAYWFTPFKIERIKEVHDYLDGLPEVGKVLSLASVIRVAEQLNEGKEFDSLQLSLLYKRVPDDIKAQLIHPFVSVENNEARIRLRILDSREGLRRKELLERIDDGLHNQLKLSDEDVTVAGLLVLYNNMLQSLYSSQISTIGVVLLGIGIMFLVLFRSVSLCLIGIAPNILAATTVLGMMGLLGIPLDMMTITVAAITIGIAVDNSIHYIYRFREEFAENGDYLETLRICHSNIGRAVLYTSTTIIFGFSILVLSNFYPTVYFGLLTALAMFIALLAALTLLPKLILVFRPF
jgi:predicted RND superfamily exporter protein